MEKIKLNYLEVAQDLIKISSISNNSSALYEIIEYIEKFFEGNKVYVKRYERNNKPSIVISTRDTITPDILIVGHLDVVPADKDMFNPLIKENVLYGRGACDMKSEVAVGMDILKEISQLNNTISIALMLTTDEELGGKDGVNYLVNEIGYRCKVALVPDSGESLQELVNRNKGILHITLSSKGESAHGSRPWLGKNAIDNLITAYSNIKQEFPIIDLESDHWHNTCNIGMIKGGLATNLVPSDATCSLDIRFTEGTDPNDIMNKIQNIAPNITIKVDSIGESSYTPFDNPYLKYYVDLVQKYYELNVIAKNSHGANDGRYLSSFGIPVISSRPLSGGQHSNNEWVDLESLSIFRQIYQKFITTINIL